MRGYDCRYGLVWIRMDDSQYIIPVGEVGIALNYDHRDIALYVALGAALAQAQVLEFGIAIMLGFIKSQGGDDFKEHADGFLEKTLGALAHQIRSHTSDSTLSTQLEEIVEKRNYIAHRILRKYGWPMMSDEEYLAAIKEMDDIRQFLADSKLVVTRALKEAKDLPVISFEIGTGTGQPRRVL